MGYDRNIPQVYSTDDDDHITIYNWRNLADALQNTNPELMGYGTDYKKPASVKTEKFCGMLMSKEDDCKNTEDKVIEGLVANDTQFSKKSGLSDQSVLDRNGANFDDKLQASDLRGTVTRNYDEKYRIGNSVRINRPTPKTKSSSSKD